MGKVITMYAVKKEDSALLPILQEMDRKRDIKIIAAYERQKLVAAKEKRRKQS
jgi:hypothetical protein